MEEALSNDLMDFGKEVIPGVLASKPVNGYVFPGYWEDIGTIRNYYEANLDLTRIAPDFNVYDEEHPIFTHRRNLPASKLNYCAINQSLAAEGCIITNASITNSIVGIRTIIESGASLDGVVCIGADFYETDQEKAENARKGIPNIGIGRGSILKGCIIDKNARIGENCRIGIDERERSEGDHGAYHVVDGIIVIPKNTMLPPGSSI
jgi:glucose-1-phosphate adenylyltransferase